MTIRGTTLTGTLAGVRGRVNELGRDWGEGVLRTVTGDYNILVFPKYYALFSKHLVDGNRVMITGCCVERENGTGVLAWHIVKNPL